MRLSITRSLTFILVLGGGVISPAPLFSKEYRLFTTFYESTCATVFQMDDQGNLTEGDSYEVGYDAERIACSPNGQLVVVSSSITPWLSAFFINSDGSIEPPKGYNPFPPGHYDPPFGFHLTEPWAYADFLCTNFQFEVDYADKELRTTSCTLLLRDDDIAHSLWSDHLYYRDTYEYDNTGVRGVGLSPDGCFTTTTTVARVARGSATKDFALSPDGRWAAVIGLMTPQLSFVKIQRDGTPVLHHQFTFDSSRFHMAERLRFTPDGRYLIFLTGGPDDLISFRHDPATDQWVEAAYAQFFGGPFDFAITPDGRYLVWISNSPGWQPDGWYYRTLQPIRIHADGSFSVVEGAGLAVPGFLATLEFIPPWRETYPGPSGLLLR